MIISIQIPQYSSEEQLTIILEGILKQTQDYFLEVNITESETIEDWERFLKRFPIDPNKISLNLYNSDDDYWGLCKATGQYIAFCYGDDIWCKTDKLKNQVTFLENNTEYIACTHDIDLVDTNGISYRYSFQKAYKRRRYSENYIYSWRELQQNLYPGAVSSLVCRNIFDETLRIMFQKQKNVSPKLLLIAIIAFSGLCCNLYNQQFVKRICPADATNAPYYPPLDKDTFYQQLNEFSEIAKLGADLYAVDFDTDYRAFYLLNCFFSYYVKDKSPELLTVFMKEYDALYRPEYNTNAETTHSSPEKRQLFINLKSKVRNYQIRNGNENELWLLKYENVLSDNTIIEYALKCYRNNSKANQIWRAELIRVAENPQYVKQQIRKRIFSVPYRKTVRYISKKVRGLHRFFKRIVTRNLRKKGYSAYMANEWYDTMRLDLLKNKNASLSEKIWCYRRGFLPWRLPQYGATKENYQDFLSDRDYMYLHQINNSYKKWIEDKMTFRYVLEPFKEFLPKYYYQIIRREGYTVLVPLMDCPYGYEATFDELFRLLREKGKLALKSASGTHGIGFYKLEYKDNVYYANNKISSEYEIKKIILNFKSYYVVTEYVTMHDAIRDIYDGSVNTIRIMMINKDVYHPQLLDAYMRIGSSRSGVTDNIAFGGVTCAIDMETGYYSGGEQLADHKYIPCTHHPDTGTLIEGTIPRWDFIKEKVIELCKYIGQLEYLGFDIVVTPDAFCILEINSHQDLHKFYRYDPQIKRFLFDRLERKCKNHHIKRI